MDPTAFKEEHTPDLEVYLDATLSGTHPALLCGLTSQTHLPCMDPGDMDLSLLHSNMDREQHTDILHRDHSCQHWVNDLCVGEGT